MINNNNPIFNMFGGFTNFQNQFNQFAQNVPTGFNPQQQVQQLLNSGQMSQEQFNYFRSIANMITGRRN